MALHEVDNKYMQAREMALAANLVKGASSCVGEGRCCAANVPLSKNDIAIITNDILEGRISHGALDDAIKRSNDPQNNRCPFLTDNNRCSIYESRPYVCISWGIGGKPVPEYSRLVEDWVRITNSKEEIDGNYERAAKEWKKDRKPSTVPNLALTQATCLDCRFNTAWEATPIEANEGMIVANLIYREVLRENGEKSKRSITLFARVDLPLIVGRDTSVSPSIAPMSRQIRRQLERSERKKKR